MFAPKNYVSMYEVVSILFRELKLSDLESHFANGVSIPDRHGMSSITNVEDFLENCACWLISAESKTKSGVVVCSPRGDIVEISGEVLLSFDNPFWFLDEANDSNGIEDFFLSLIEKFGVGALGELDILGFTTDYGPSTSSRNFPLFYNRQSYTVTTRNFGILRELFERGFENDDFENYLSDEITFRNALYSDVLRQFEGWSICAPESVVEKTATVPSIQHLMAGGGWHSKTDEMDAPKPGRPRKQIEKAKQMVTKQFGGQHQSLTRKQIYRELGDPIDQFSLKTLGRALTELDKSNGQN